MLLASANCLFPSMPFYKHEALQLFFGDEQRFTKAISPLVQHRYDSAMWNYVERNYKASDHVTSPLQRTKDHRGNMLNVEFMHTPSGLLVKQSPLVNAPDTSITSDGAIPQTLGFVYGL